MLYIRISGRLYIAILEVRAAVAACTLPTLRKPRGQSTGLVVLSGCKTRVVILRWINCGARVRFRLKHFPNRCRDIRLRHQERKVLANRLIRRIDIESSKVGFQTAAQIPRLESGHAEVEECVDALGLDEKDGFEDGQRLLVVSALNHPLTCCESLLVG